MATRTRSPQLAASDVVTTVREAVATALGERRLRPENGRILVALSGGPDSRVLLDALVAIAVPMSLQLTVCVVDHGLRRGSAREARAALDVAKRLGVSGTVERVVVEEKSARGAREARYAALARAAVACRAEAIALGHTASDQAETLLDHLLRGAGSRGLGAMEPKRPLHVVGTEHVVLIRPLLEVSRVQIEAYVETEGLAVVRDPTNLDLRYRRSRIRARVMPLLREERPDLDLALVRLCERLRQDAEYLEHQASEARARLTTLGFLDLDGLGSLPPALQARVLRAMCEEVGVPGDRIPLDALLRLGRGRHGTSHIDLPGGVIAERRYGTLRVTVGAGAGVPTEVAGELAIVKAGRYPVGSLTLHVPAASLKQGPLVLRRPRAGDRIGSRKLSDLLIDHKVARPDRKQVWALADAASPGALRWASLPTTPGTKPWEWPSSGIRPRLEPSVKSRSRH